MKGQQIIHQLLIGVDSLKSQILSPFSKNRSKKTIAFNSITVTRYCLIFFVLNSFQLSGQSFPLILQQNSTFISTTISVTTASDKSTIISGRNIGQLNLGTNTFNDSASYLTRYDSTGQNLWIIPAGKYFTTGAYSKMPRAVLDNNDDIFFLGEFDDTCFIGTSVLTDTGVGNSFLAKINAAGGVIWVKKLTNDRVKFSDLAIDIYGNIFLTGYLNGTLIMGNDTLVSQGFDVLLLKLDPTGDFAWMKKAGGPPSPNNNSEKGYSVATDSLGNCYVAGYLRSINPVFDTIVIPISSTAGFTGFVAKYDSAGVALWAKKCGYESTTVASDMSGNIFVGGYTYSNLAYDTIFVSGGTGGNVRAFVASIHSNGQLKWAQVFRADYSNTNGVTTDNNGNCYATGVCRDTTKIYGIQDSLVLYNNIYPQPNNCGFIVGLDSMGNPFYGDLIKTSTYSIGMIDVNYRNCRLAFTGNFGNQLPVYYNNDSLLAIGSGSGFAIVQDGCSSFTSMNEIASLNRTVNVFPNPFSHTLNVTSVFSTPMEIIIYDCTARQVLRKLFSNSAILSTEHFSKGMYFYEVRSREGTCGKGKIVKN